VALVIGQRARLEFALQQGTAELDAQSVTAQRVKQVEVQRMSVSAPVSTEEIESFPLSSRGIVNLAGITPGIKTYAPQSGRPRPSGGVAPDLRFFKETHLRRVDRATLNIDNGWGSHVLKFGVELSSIAATQNQPNNTNGSFNFLTDTSSLPNTASIAVGFTDPNGTSDAIATATGYTTGVYINDEWRIKPNFTVSLGVRHDAELNTMNNKYVTPWSKDPVLQAIPDLQNYLNAGNRKNQLGNISPRVSFSWDPFKTNRTFVRGGVGIIYDRVTSFMGFQERRNSTWRTYNFTFNNTTSLATKDPTVLRQRVISGQSGALAPILMNLAMKTPHSRQMSVGDRSNHIPLFVCCLAMQRSCATRVCPRPLSESTERAHDFHTARKCPIFRGSHSKKLRSGSRASHLGRNRDSTPNQMGRPIASMPPPRYVVKTTAPLPALRPTSSGMGTESTLRASAC